MYYLYNEDFDVIGHVVKKVVYDVLADAAVVAFQNPSRLHYILNIPCLHYTINGSTGLVIVNNYRLKKILS